MNDRLLFAKGVELMSVQMMSLPMTKRLFTVDEFYRMAEIGIFTEDDRVELIEGEIIQMTPIGNRHLACVNRLARILITAIKNRAIVSIQNPVRLSNRTEPQPDIVVLKYRSDDYEGKKPSPEDVYFMVEVSDSSYEYDRQIKIPLCAINNIPEIWIANLDRRVIEIYRQPSPEGYRQSFIVSPGESISPQSFPEYSFKVSDILG